MPAASGSNFKNSKDIEIKLPTVYYEPMNIKISVLCFLFSTLLYPELSACDSDGRCFDAKIYGKNEKFILCPDTETGKYAFDISENYPIKTESAVVLKRNGRSRSDIINILAGISSIKGTKYYSETEKKVITLFSDACTVKSVSEPDPVPDMFFSDDLPETFTAAGKLKDSRFGSNIYIFSYKIDGNNISMRITNSDTLKFSIFNAVEKNNFIFLIDITIEEENILVYSAGLCKPASVPFLKKRINSSIINRMDALLRWFKGEIKDENKK